jgi:hypothetical protein
MVRDKRARGGATRDWMHHRCLDLQVTARDQTLADGLDNPRSSYKDVPAVLVGDKVEIPLAIFLFLIGQAMKLFG